MTIVNTGGAPVDLSDHVLKLRNNGGVVELRTLDDTLTDCAAWSFGNC